MAKGDRARTARLAASSSERLEQRLTQVNTRWMNVRRSDEGYSDEGYSRDTKLVNRLEAELERRAIENSPYSSLYRKNPNGYGNYSVFVDRDTNDGGMKFSYKSTTYYINGRTVDTHVSNQGIYSGRAEKGNRTTSKRFDTVAEAVAYVDRQLKRRGVKPR